MSTPKITPKAAYTYKQARKVARVLKPILKLNLWNIMTEEEQEKAKTSNAEIYRVAFCVYNEIPLMNILRYFPDKTKVVKSKAFATYNLTTMRPTMNSQHKVEFEQPTIDKITKILDLPKIMKSSWISKIRHFDNDDSDSEDSDIEVVQ